MKRFLVLLLLALPLFGSAQQWVIDLKDDAQDSNIVNGILNNNGDIIVVGACGENLASGNPMIMRVSSDGDYDVHVVSDSLFGFLNQGLTLCGIIQLKNGNYLLIVCVSVDISIIPKFGIIVCDDDFKIVSSRFYEADSIAEEVIPGQLLLDDDGTVVMCGNYKYIAGTQIIRRPLFYRFNEMGDSISCRYVKPSPSDPECYIQSFECNQIKKDPRTDGFIVFGDGNNGLNSVLFYDSDFNYISQFCPNNRFGCMNSDTWIDEDRMLVYGHTLGTETWDLMLADVSLDGTVNRYDDIYSIPDTCVNAGGAGYHWMAMVNDTTIYGSYYIYADFKGAYDTKPGVCLFTKNMEVLAIKTLSSAFIGCYSRLIIPLPDGGCVLLGSHLNYGRYHLDAFIIKFSREDLNPIPCSVKEIPQERLQAVAFPNPTHGELNIDISNIPGDTENRVSITDMHGVVRMSRIIRGDGNLLTIDASSLEAGTYVYSVFNNKKELLNGKFVKK